MDIGQLVRRKWQLMNGKGFNVTKMHYSKGRTVLNEKKRRTSKTNLWNIAEYGHALNIIISAGIGGRAAP